MSYEPPESYDIADFSDHKESAAPMVDYSSKAKAAKEDLNTLMDIGAHDRSYYGDKAKKFKYNQ